MRSFAIILVSSTIFMCITVAHSSDTIPPCIFSPSPADGAIVTIPLREASVIITDNNSGVDWAKCNISLTDPKNRCVAGTIQYDSISGKLILNGFDLSVDGQYNIHITGYDLVGNNTKTICHFTYIFSAMGKVIIVSTSGVRDTIFPKKGERAIIVFKPTQAGKIIAKIYNLYGVLAGEKIYNSSGPNDPNNYILWACDNTEGEQLPPGVYLARVEGPGFNITKQILIAR